MIISAMLSVIGTGPGTGGCLRTVPCRTCREDLPLRELGRGGPRSPTVVDGSFWKLSLSSCSFETGIFLAEPVLRLGCFMCNALEYQVRELASLVGRQPLLGLRGDHLSLSMWARALGLASSWPVSSSSHVGFHSSLSPWVFLQVVS